MGGRTGENGSCLILACVDQYGDGDFSGRLYHPDWQDGQGFCSAMQMLLQIEALLGQEQTQQSSGAKRMFSVPTTGDIPFGAKAPSGSTATFQLRILFRQNASWQGSVAWVEGRREESFRSVLELLLLMNSAMECGEPVRGTAKAR